MPSVNDLPGFRNAPVSKLLFTFVGGLSTYANLAETPSLSTIRHPVWRMVSSQWVFTGIGSTVLGSYLVYRLRVIERRYGSAKFVSLVFFSAVLSMIFYQILDTCGLPIITGPMTMIFALLYQFHRLVPATSPQKIWHFTATDKSVVYLGAAQFLSFHAPASLLPAIAGWLSGAVYSANIGNISRWRFPQAIRSLASRYLLPFLGTSGPISTPSSRTSPTTGRPSRSHQPEEVQVPPSSENVDTLMSMFPDRTRENVSSALVSSNHDVNRAAEILLTTAPSASS
ncbi:hypothetical protein DM01DRAFT_1406016 [Hesseltinella vesiculosa]|uniref:CUE domain-containing protein n=1 Tax=Hesseltinella vesiculosa TaxID=101127 RepID=A0A1X2GMR5_9FUNG|nr:hypothetical protein DM01DRAFT_1406016 [Hesseltinella vesiculosa]